MVERQARDLGSEVEILVQVVIFLLNLNCIFQATIYRFVFTYQFDLKHQNK